MTRAPARPEESRNQHAGIDVAADPGAARDPATPPLENRSALEAVERITAALDRLLAGETLRKQPLAIAVSGGSDSAGLLLAAARWAPRRGQTLLAVTVDHRLRRESAAEAAAVSRLAESLGVPHMALRWADAPDPALGNLAAAARDARYRLIADWARAEGVAAVAVAHTRDDVAETLLIRLARGSGVDGLAEMAERGAIQAADGEPVPLLRPCLDVAREDLRALCHAAGVDWIEDPSNEDPRFDRTLARKALAALEPLGIARDGLAATARRLRRARGALEQATDQLIDRAARLCPSLCWAEIDGAALAGAPREIGLRALARLLEWVSGAPYPPRLEPLEAAFDAVAAGGPGRTLHGVALDPAEDGRWSLCRETAAMAEPIPIFQAEAAQWDRRWRFTVGRLETGMLGGPLSEVAVGPLGEPGLLALKYEAEAAEATARTNAWRASPAFRAAPRRARLATPALWSAERLVSAPLAGFHPDRLSAELRRPRPHRAETSVSIRDHPAPTDG